MYWRVDKRSVEEILTGPHFSEPIPGAEITCPCCGGDGEFFDNNKREYVPCELCEEQGWIWYDNSVDEHREAYRQEGLSCFDSPEKLYAYFKSGLFVPEHKIDEVIIFTGEEVGYGLDDELLVIPSGHVRPRKISWEKFSALMEARSKKNIKR